MQVTAIFYAAAALLSATQTLAVATPSTNATAKVDGIQVERVQPLIATDPGK